MQQFSTVERPLDKLIRYISDHQMKQGSRLPPVKALVQKLGLPPHAVRDALMQAQTMGLVRVEPRSGSFVESPNFGTVSAMLSKSLPLVLNGKDRNLLDLLEARRLIEVELAALAAARRRLADLIVLRDAQQAMYDSADNYELYMTHNTDFHLGIAKIAGNEMLTSIVSCLMTLLRPTLGQRAPENWKEKDSEKRRRDIAEHLAIFNALLAGDAVAARSAMSAHLQDTMETLLPTYHQMEQDAQTRA